MDTCNSLICNKMAEHYQSLLESGTFSDAVLVVGKKELRVHKLILSTRSPVFAAMFTNESTKEAQENRVEIIDVDVEVMELLVRYIYTGKVETAYLYAVDLLIAADKYQLYCLKSICEQKLLYQITTESASDLLIFGDMYRTTELTSKCLDYITNNGTQVMATVGWEKIRVKVDLLVMLYERLHLKYSNLARANDLEIDSTKENDSAVD